MRAWLPLCFLGWATLALGDEPAPLRCWTGFRGDGTSVLNSANLPTEWSARGRKHFAWNIRLPGYGQSCPVVWGDRVFVTAVDGEKKERLLLMAIDLASGKKQWQREFAGTQHVADGDTVSRGAPTPVVDGQRIYAMYESGDLIALDHDGNELWKRSLVRDYGEFQGPHGYASSLAQTANSVLVQVTHRGPSYLLAVDKRTGEYLWKSELPEKTGWSSPVVVQRNGQPLALISASETLAAVDATSGKVLWQVNDLKGNTAPSPTVAGELVVVASSNPGFTRAYRLDQGRGGENVAPVWTAEKVTSSYGSPLVYRGYVYLVNKAGVATCVELQSGETRWSERLPGVCWATPLAAGDHIYFFSKEGTTAVYEAGPSAKKVAENELSITDDVYGVAAVENSILIRSGRGLVCVTTQPPTDNDSPSANP